MTQENRRAETVRENDDRELIDNMEDAPSQGGRSGHTIADDIGARDELARETGGPGITRVRGSDKAEDADLPRFNET